VSRHLSLFEPTNLCSTAPLSGGHDKHTSAKLNLDLGPRCQTELPAQHGWDHHAPILADFAEKPLHRIDDNRMPQLLIGSSSQFLWALPIAAMQVDNV
jgi:hypothetical protein